ncbi:hypothetical protein [Streptomyces zaomyceticus]|uniref:hypothetical protein n=1 Tax=Streptomyces zaomyceticus TaxID=68286 RepID=UPI0037AECD0C
MSHDYVAIVTSLNAAVLLVATLQYGSLIRKVVDQLLSYGEGRLTRLGQLIEARRNQVEPSVSDLLALRPISKKAAARKYAVYMIASGVYLGLCTGILGSQVRILKWAGTANAGPDPKLAENAFYTTVIAIVFLVIETAVVNFASGIRRVREMGQNFQSTYSDQERLELISMLDAAVSPPPPPTSSPATEP